MREPPPKLGPAAVLAFADVSAATSTGATRHYADGAELSGFAGLAIARFPDDPGVYLYYCDADWQIRTDTYHDTVDDAIAQAELEFGPLAFRTAARRV